jgi:hypothetical protein
VEKISEEHGLLPARAVENFNSWKNYGLELQGYRLRDYCFLLLAFDEGYVKCLLDHCGGMIQATKGFAPCQRKNDFISPKKTVNYYSQIGQEKYPEQMSAVSTQLNKPTMLEPAAGLWRTLWAQSLTVSKEFFNFS